MSLRWARGLVAATVTAAAIIWPAATPGAAGAAEPAPEWVQAVARDVRLWLWRQGFPVPDRPVWVATNGDLPPAPRHGEVVLAAATRNGPVLNPQVVRAARRDATLLPEVLIHELLHLLRDPDEFADLTEPERELEEGAVTAVTEDLLPRFMLARRGVTVITWASDHPYGPLMRMVRGVSQRATGARWHQRPARHWRYRLVRADRHARAAMWARATGVSQ